MQNQPANSRKSGTEAHTGNFAIQSSDLCIRVVDNFFEMNGQVGILFCQGLAKIFLVYTFGNVSERRLASQTSHLHFLNCLVCPEAQRTTCAFDYDTRAQATQDTCFVLLARLEIGYHSVIRVVQRGAASRARRVPSTQVRQAQSSCTVRTEDVTFDNKFRQLDRTDSELSDPDILNEPAGSNQSFVSQLLSTLQRIASEHVLHDCQRTIKPRQAATDLRLVPGSTNLPD